MRYRHLLQLLSVPVFGLLVMTSVSSNTLTMEAKPSQSVLRSNTPQSIFIKISLKGIALDSQDRAPVNIGLVIDKSTSMKNGAKLQRVKQAAIRALRLLGSQDTISIVAFNDSVEIIQPATKMTESQGVSQSIQSIKPAGKSALFAGLSKGANEVRTFLAQNQINRVILVSDGHASVGPRAPSELGALGDVLRKEGISVTTIGLGNAYNEDLLQKIAYQSGGNHAYAETADALNQIFENEFRDILSVVARDALIQIRCLPGIRPIRVFGENAVINGATIEVSLNQIYSNQDKYIIVEVEIPPLATGRELAVAQVSTQYTNLQSKLKHTLSTNVAVRFSNSPELINQSVNKDVMIATVFYFAARENQRAITYLDKKKYNAAEQVLNESANLIRTYAERYQSKALSQLANKIMLTARRLQRRERVKSRKQLRYFSHQLMTQQRW